jgi:hypothetical protein
LARLPVSDVADLIGVDEIVRSGDQPNGRLELFDIAGPVESEKCVDALELALPVCPLLSYEIGAARSNHRSVNASEYGEDDGTCAAHVDGLCAYLECRAHAIEYVTRSRSAAGVARRLDVVIEVVAGRGGRGPCDVIVSADQNGRHPGEGHA